MRCHRSPTSAAHPFWRSAGATSAALAVGGLAGCTAESGAWWFGSLALLLAAAGGLGTGWLLGAGRQARELHAARQQARLAEALGGDLAWQTDSTHRLAPGPLGSGEAPLGDVLSSAGDDDAALRDALQRQAPIDGLPVHRSGDDRLWILRAAPRFDARGAFQGHQGVLRPLDDGGPAGAALAALLDGLPGPALLAGRADAAPRWRVLQANAAAREHFGPGPLIDDTKLAAALPAGLQPAWAAAEARAEADGWQLRRLALPPQTLCLLWQGAADTRDADEQASFSYTVSHDLRAPIRVVEGFTRIVKEDYGQLLDRIANDHLDRVLGAAARMNQMIDAMLTLARLSSQPLVRQPVNLTQLAGFVVDDLRRSAPEREAQIEIETGMQVHGDPTLLRLVLENLLGNAWKYTGRRSHARIEFARETVDGAPVFVVRDNGAGFDMRSAERLFGLFQRLHSANDFPGTGVGLASVRRIVQRHGGDIWADGEPGRGAAFHFTLRE